ncbi:MAG: glycosyltransferase family 2 protein [Candidatus Heimdallarchaeota archaeon]|nr:MAG: glycosyltransferase family 2 protein [Candidatus Heimdallarchaeota archaeon]
MGKSDFFVLLPAFNEENTLPKVIQQLLEIFSPDQIILADDGSTDNTSSIARESGIKIIRNRNNRGKGYILRNSFAIIIDKFPDVKWVLTVDADGQHDVRDIPRFIQTINHNPRVDIIVGKRDYNQMPPINWISNKITSSWSNFWLNWDLHDLQCGFRCYRTDTLRRILEIGLTKNKFDLETEILIISWILNERIIEIPIKTLYPNTRRKSRIQPVIDTFRWILLVSKFAFSLQFTTKVWQRRYLHRL